MITQIVSQGDGTAHLFYGGNDHIRLNLGGNEAAAIAALIAMLAPIDVTSYIF